VYFFFVIFLTKDTNSKVKNSSPIEYLNVEDADIFLALSTESYIKYYYSVRPKGVIIVDEQVDHKLYLAGVNVFPIIRTVR
jgi:hypothetical protein